MEPDTVTSTLPSFDVFDTVITRAIGDPHEVAREVGRRLQSDKILEVKPAVWFTARRYSEHTLTLRLGRAPDIYEIHADMAIRLGYPSDAAERTVEAELQVERELCRLVPGASDSVRAARRSSDAGVVFVSDTPLPSDFLIELLQKVGVWEIGDRCYASSERRASKADGCLFSVVEADFRRSCAAIHHTGDNVVSDVGRARLAGWTAELHDRAALNRYERALERHSDATDGLTSWLAGASRLARLDAREKRIDASLADVAAGVAGPLVLGFTSWLLRSASSCGVRRLYFLSRDGHVFYEAASIIGTTIDSTVDCRYLYGSRLAWRSDPSERLTIDESASLQRFASPSQEIIQDYLRQEQLGDGIPYGIVDVGWAGRTNKYLVDRLQRAGMDLPTAHYSVGVGDDAVDVSSPLVVKRLYGWLFDPPRAGGVERHMNGEIALIEMFCAADHGSVCGYRRAADGIEPTLAQPRNEPALRWGAADVRWVIKRFLEYAADIPGLDQPTDLRPAAWDCMNLFWRKPSAVEVERWGTFPFELNNDGVASPIAERVNVRKVIANVTHGEFKVRNVDSWLAGTTRKSSWPIRTILRLRHLYVAVAPRIRRIPDRMQWEAAARSPRVAGMVRRLRRRRSPSWSSPEVGSDVTRAARSVE